MGDVPEAIESESPGDSKDSARAWFVGAVGDSSLTASERLMGRWLDRGEGVLAGEDF